MNELKIFEKEEFGRVRIVTVDDEPWFVASDVCKALGILNTTQATQKLDDDERSMFNIGRQGEANCVNEYGLYSLTLASRKKSAHAFKRWITHDVIPSLRKHGMYATDELLNDPDLAIKAFTALKEEREKNRLLEAENNEMKPKALFADAVAASETSILIGDLAKILRQNGIEMGQKRLFDWMRENGYLIRSGASRNMPQQRYMESGIFEIKETTINNPDGSIRVTKTTKVTGKGQQYFVNKFLGN